MTALAAQDWEKGVQEPWPPASHGHQGVSVPQL